MSFETITEIEHYTDKLFRFRTTRTVPIPIQAGQFCLISMPDGKHKRAYSYTNGPFDPFYEFYSIKVPNGPLTSKLQNIKEGDYIWVGDRPSGTLVLNNLVSGKTLWLLSTGTGIAPFISLLRDNKTFEQFENVVVTHSVRTVKELAAYETFVRSKTTRFFTSVTREEHTHVGRLQKFIDNNQLFTEMNLPFWDTATDRIMLCGSEQFNKDFRHYFSALGFTEGTSKEPGTLLVEKAFVS